MRRTRPQNFITRSPARLSTTSPRHWRRTIPGSSHASCTTSSTGTAHLATLSFQIWHLRHCGLRCIRGCCPEHADVRKYGTASIKIHRSSGIVRRHGACLHAVQVADNAGKVAHEDLARVDSLLGKRWRFHERCQLHRLIFGKHNGRL